MPVRVVSTRDQQPLTVNALVANPLVIAERILSELKDQFITDQILRNSGKATGGAVSYRVSSGIFADRSAEVVNEGAEIPVATRTRGDLASKPVQKRGLGVEITQEMRDRNDIGEVERQIQVVKNTVRRDIDGAFFTALDTAITQTAAATAVWSHATDARIRKDILAAKKTVRTASVTTGSYLGYEPTHLLLSVDDEADLLANSEFLNLVFGSSNPQNVGSLNQVDNILGLKPLVSVGLTAGKAYVVEAKTIGGYADERPLQTTELYEHNRSAEVYRADTTRSTAAFVDQPKAGAEITGV